jgi:hypothetical protein
MATKKCPNGHQYDSSIYGDNCPFCPSGEYVNTSHAGGTMINDGKTAVINGGDNPTKPTVPVSPANEGGGRTVIRSAAGTTIGPSDGGRRLVGLLVSYSQNPLGEVYKVYEGKTLVGRDATCDIPFTNDSNMSSKHLLIQYVEAKGAFKAQDQGSSNGTYVNGQIYVMGDFIDLQNGDVIVMGATKMVFLTIPAI